ncbi:hypothetical protein BJX61DRAFT_503325 [Aspergillus egyptiacus]|nr:hypothetical protein BJX61DRAFT_503325 [Aspergillus egyptiacus]
MSGATSKDILASGAKLAWTYGKPALGKAANLTSQAAKETVRWAAENPGTAASLAVFASPAIVAAPVLSAVGFGAAGVQAGSMAALWHSMIGNAVAGGAFATFQSAGAGGAGAAVVNGVVQGGAAMVGIGGRIVDVGNATWGWVRAKL